MEIAPEFLEASHQGGGAAEFSRVAVGQGVGEPENAGAECIVVTGLGDGETIGDGLEGGGDFLGEGGILAEAAPNHQPLEGGKAFCDLDGISRGKDIAVVDDGGLEVWQEVGEDIQMDMTAVHLDAGAWMDDDGRERISVDAIEACCERIGRGVAEADFDGKPVWHPLASGFEHFFENGRVFGKTGAASLFGDEFPGAAAIEICLVIAEISQCLEHIGKSGGVLSDDLGNGLQGTIGFREHVGEHRGLHAAGSAEGDKGSEGGANSVELFAEAGAKIAERDTAKGCEIDGEGHGKGGQSGGSR